MSYQVYRVLHLLGIFLLFAALGGSILRAMAGEKARDGASKLAGATHGVALLLLLVTGFGLLAKLGLAFPVWAWGKVVLWLLLGGVVVVARRSAATARWLWWVVPLLGAAAAYLAIYKPVW